ncbi:MAG: hypothetical protein PUD90_09675 [Clostridia bacterium]|nr:hypothetical protein [Clostridia bacterium]
MLSKYEQLLDKADKNNVAVYENWDFGDTRLKGLYCDGAVALDKRLETDADKISILSEELGHHETAAGNIIDLRCESNRKQEYAARMWAYNEVVGLRGIIDCHNACCHNLFEMAEHLQVSETFLTEALDAYNLKYGAYAEVDNYIIVFEPSLTVIEKTF